MRDLGMGSVDRFRAFVDVTQAFAAATADYERLLDVVAQRTAEVVGDSCLLSLVSEDGRHLVRASVFDRDPASLALVRQVTGAGRAPLDAPHPTLARVIHEGQSVLLREVDISVIAPEGDPESLTAALGLQVRSLLMVPLRARGRSLGALTILRRGEAAAPLDEQDLSIAEALAGHAAVALSNALLLAAERYARASAERAESARRAADARFRAIVENVPDVVWTRDAAGRLHYVSPNVERMCGFSQEEFLAQGVGLSRSRVHPEDAPALAAASEALLATGTPMDLDHRFRHRDGRWLVVRTRAAAVREVEGVRYVDGTSTDVTERRGLEAQLRQTHKMEAVGRLAGGVAHDFNNMLSVILGYADLALADLRPDEPPAEELGEIRKAGMRAAALTHQLLAFSRQQVLTPRVLDLAEVVAGVEKMLRRLVGEDVDLRLVAAPGGGRCKVDPGQIEQVVTNLVVNARDAMPRGGRLTIETSAVELDAADAADHLEVAPGPYMRLAVSDTGSGMDEATRAQIFEPFFTTKEMGKGTGLGLSTVFGIVKQSGGHIWVHSEPGAGTTFKVYFPRVAAGADSPRLTPVPTVLRGSETVLLVEDEEAVRTLTRHVLRRNGYHVLDAANAGEALLQCEQFGGEIHLLVTDVVMPRMSGRQLAERLAPMRPDMRVLYMSGYTDDAILHHGVLEAAHAFLSKPILPVALLQKVREVLDDPRGK